MTSRTFPSRIQKSGESWPARTFPARGGGGPPSDTTPPVISSISSTVTTTSVAVAWTTDEAADGQVEWGVTTAYGSFTVVNPNFIIDHHEAINGLTNGQTIHYRVRSKDTQGNPAVSADHTATTNSPVDVTPPVISAIADAPTSPSTSSRLITWTTDELSDTIVGYRVLGSGAALKYKTNLTLTTSHSITITGLTADTVYDYEVVSRDAAGNATITSGLIFATDAAAPGQFSQMTLTNVTNTVIDPSGLSPSYNAIGMVITFTGGARTQTATLRFKKHADSTWRNGLPLVLVVNGTETSLRGSVLNGIVPGLLESDMLSNTSYDVEVTITDGGEQGVVTATVSTKNDAISTPATLQAAATRYCDPVAGNDSWDGTALTHGSGSVGPWKTLDKVLRTAPTNAVVLMRKGHYTPTGYTRTTAVTLVGETLPVKEVSVWAAGRVRVRMDRDNESLKAVIEPTIVGPTGAGDTDIAGTAPWSQVTLTGPGLGGATPGAQYTVWKWTSPISNATQLAWCATRWGEMNRVAQWKAVYSAQVPALGYPAGAVELIRTNLSYHWGFFVPPPVNGSFAFTASNNVNEVYLVCDDTFLPNSYYWSLGGNGDAGISLNGANIRVCGLELRGMQNGIFYGAGSSNAIIDHCLISGNEDDVRLDSARPATLQLDPLLQYCRITDTSLWVDDGGAHTPTFQHIPWAWVKLATVNADGSTNATQFHLGDHNEVSGISGIGIARRLVVRYCTFMGLFDGPSLGNSNYDFGSLASEGTEFYRNWVQNCVDDFSQIAYWCSNTRIWDNLIHETLTLLASPTYGGPVDFYRNDCVRQGNRGVANNLPTDSAGQNRVTGVGNKYSGAGYPPGVLREHHNAIWSDLAQFNGGALFAQNDSNALSEFIQTRNNIIRANAYAFVVQKTGGGTRHNWDGDYNDLSTDDATRGMQIQGDSQIFDLTIAGFRTHYGTDIHSNPTWDLHDLPDNQLGEPLNGLMTPLPGAYRGIGVGVAVANLSDQSNQRVGSVPNIGMHEIAYTVPREGSKQQGQFDSSIGAQTIATMTLEAPTHPVIIVRFLQFANANHITAVSCHGAALSKLGSDVTVGSMTASFWTLAAPTTGALSVTTDAAIHIAFRADICYGAKQTSFLTAEASHTSAGLTPTVSIDCTSIRGVVVLDILGLDHVAGTDTTAPTEPRYGAGSALHAAGDTFFGTLFEGADPQTAGYTVDVAHSTSHVYRAVGVLPYGS